MTVTSMQGLLDQGLRDGLFSGAAAGFWNATGWELAVAGTHAFDNDTSVSMDSVFDLASISKTFTAVVLMKLVEAGVVDLDDRVCELLPVGSGRYTPKITLRMLLTHTSGLPAISDLWRDSPGIAPEDRLQAILSTPLLTMPGAEYRYSCLGYIAAAALAEEVTGERLPALLARLVTVPLGLSTVRYGPVDKHLAVATEEEPWLDRGLVQGEVHDETSWYLGGVSGNAGLFGTALDVLTFAHSFIDGAVLGPQALRDMTHDQLDQSIDAPRGQGIGPWINDREVFGDVKAFGHPGFTGTLWFVVPDTNTAAVLLTNRVHPSRDRVEIDAFRRLFVAWIANL